MNCVQCGHELAERAKFCPECGAQQQVKCSGCGALLDSQVRFCGECGAKVVSKVGAGETAPVSRIDIGPLALGLPECKVDITEVRAEGPSDDGDYGLTIKYSVTNDTDEDWEYFETRTQILNASGQILEETRDSNEQAISSGETAELETSLWGVKGKLLGVNPEQAHVVVSFIACGFGQEKFGEVAIPEIPYEAVAIRPGRIGDMLQLVSGSLWKTEPDDDKDCRVEIKALVQNLTDKHLPQVKIVADVMDKQGRDVTDASGSDEVRPGNLVLISGSGYGKEKKLAGAKVNLALRAYWPVAAGTVQQRGIMVAEAKESSESGGGIPGYY
jgi:RNA polymerase subunit RPABC4/transcription elongation factor Spt4